MDATIVPSNNENKMMISSSPRKDHSDLPRCTFGFENSEENGVKIIKVDFTHHPEPGAPRARSEKSMSLVQQAREKETLSSCGCLKNKFSEHSWVARFSDWMFQNCSRNAELQQESRFCDSAAAVDHVEIHFSSEDWNQISATATTLENITKDNGVQSTQLVGAPYGEFCWRVISSEREFMVCVQHFDLDRRSLEGLLVMLGCVLMNHLVDLRMSPSAKILTFATDKLVGHNGIELELLADRRASSNGEILCPATFWNDESPHSEPVLLVVRVGEFYNEACDLRRIAGQILWLGRHMFPRRLFKNRRLVLTSARIQLLTHALDEPWEWEPHRSWEELYNNLLNFCGYYHAALFLNIRKDGTVGGGYALPEVKSERCLLRATFLASRGNTLFGDWGWALGYHPNFTRDDYLRRTTIIPTYIYEDIGYQWYPGDVRAGKALLLFLPHYLRPQFATQNALTLRTMEQVKEMVNGTLFDAYERRRARWNAYWWLYFANDGKLLEHQWVLGQIIHVALIENYVTLRLWAGSYFYKTLLVDIMLFLVLGPFLFALVQFCMWREPIQDCLIRAAIWFCGWQVVFFPLRWFARRLTVKGLMRQILHRTIIFLVLDPLFRIWWSRFDFPHALIALGICCVSNIPDKVSGFLILDDPGRRNKLSVFWTILFAMYAANDSRLHMATVLFLAEQLFVWFPLLVIVVNELGPHQQLFSITPEMFRRWVIVPACFDFIVIVLRIWKL